MSGIRVVFLFIVAPWLVFAFTTNAKLNAAASSVSGSESRNTEESVTELLTESSFNLEDQLINTFFSVTVDALTNSAQGVPAITDPNSFIQFSTIGRPINLNSFNNSEAFSNPSSATDFLQAEQFALLVNHNNLVSNIEYAYWNIVNSSVALPDNDPTRWSTWRSAYDLLYTNISTMNPLTNQTTYTIQLSHRYQNYLMLQAVCTDAAVAYTTARETMSDQDWYIYSPMYIATLSNAQQEFQAVAREFQDALTTLANFANSLSSTALSEAQAMFKSTAIRSVISGVSLSTMDEIPSFHAVFAQPADWATNSDEYSSATISASNLQTTVSDAYTSWSAGGGFSGFYSLNGNGSVMSDLYAAETSELSVRYQYLLLELQRPWLFDSFLSSGGWSLPGQLQGSVSQGVANPTTGLLPSYPIYLIIVKNLNVTGNWTNNDIVYIKNHIAAGGIFGFGPFTLSGGYQYGSSNSVNSVTSGTDGNVTAAFDGISITMTGAQIVGYVQKIVQFSPALDNSSLTTTTTTIPSSSTSTSPRSSTSSASTNPSSVSTSTTMSSSPSISGSSASALNAAWSAPTVLAYFILAVGAMLSNAAF